MKLAFVVRGAAALAMFAQFAGFGAAAREARTGLRGLARHAGLLQHVFVSLVMLWTVVAAAGI